MHNSLTPVSLVQVCVCVCVCVCVLEEGGEKRKCTKTSNVMC